MLEVPMPKTRLARRLRIIDQKLRARRLLARSPRLENTERHTVLVALVQRTKQRVQRTRKISMQSRTNPIRASRTAAISKPTTHMPRTKQISRNYSVTSAHQTEFIIRPIHPRIRAATTAPAYSILAASLPAALVDEWCCCSGIRGVDICRGPAGRFNERSAHPSEPANQSEEADEGRLRCRIR
jgi:hypothetical protein